VDTLFNIKKMTRDEKEKLSTSFLKVTTPRELAECLHIKYKILIYNLYVIAEEIKYKEFEIKKRNGKTRQIVAPISGIKLIQSRLNSVLQLIYPRKSCVHGFVLSGNILTNAQTHANQRCLINIDLENFFPSINFGRVRGLFLAYPFFFNEKIATTLAQVCCYKGYLPQGAPSSPIISNFICRRLDNDLLSLATWNKCSYSRYADDITFSTSLKVFPNDIATFNKNTIELSEKFKGLIVSNGFNINFSKVRFATKYNRQEVTGLITNEFPNVNRKFVRHVRAMLHAWEKHGINKAALEHFAKYNYKNKVSTNLESSYEKQLAGKISFIGSIKGKEHAISRKLYRRLKNLAPQVKLSIAQKAIELHNLPIVFAEGKTGWKHLNAALAKLKGDGQYPRMNIEFQRYKEDLIMNNDDLLSVCKTHSKNPLHKNKIICLFDRDVYKFVREATSDGLNYKSWGNKVYSIALPVPPHRIFNQVCIEHMYLDSEIKVPDASKRRLFFSDEFDTDTGKHKEEELTCTDKNILKRKYPAIIDSRVMNGEGSNVALAKNDFAENILNKVKGFDSFTFEHFKLVFNTIQEILEREPN
jgi:RNA-directed DNA polymerase